MLTRSTRCTGGSVDSVSKPCNRQLCTRLFAGDHRSSTSHLVHDIPQSLRPPDPRCGLSQFLGTFGDRHHEIGASRSPRISKLSNQSQRIGRRLCAKFCECGSAEVSIAPKLLRLRMARRFCGRCLGRLLRKVWVKCLSLAKTCL